MFYFVLYNDDNGTNGRGNEGQGTIATGGHFILSKEFFELFAGTDSRQFNSNSGAAIIVIVPFVIKRRGLTLIGGWRNKTRRRGKLVPWALSIPLFFLFLCSQDSLGLSPIHSFKKCLFFLS